MNHVSLSSDCLVSVIIPAHNAERFIAQALDSVVAQSYPHWEICIALDCCSDGTRSIVEQYENSGRIRLVECNKGSPAGARNSALALACGELVAFLDADDWWAPTKLERCVMRLRERGCNLVWHDEIYVMHSTGERIERRYQALIHYYPDMLYRGNRISTSAVVMHNPRRSTPLFDESRDYWGTEDFMLWLDLARAGWSFSLVEEILGYYRIYSTSVSSDSVKNMRNSINVIAHFLRTDHSLNSLAQLRSRIVVFRDRAKVRIKILMARDRAV